MEADTMMTALSVDAEMPPHDQAYQELRATVAAHIAAVVSPAFLTTAAGLFDIFLAKLPTPQRQMYTCHACRDFVDTYGGLATICEDGTLQSAIWPQRSASFFAPALAAIHPMVQRARVTGVFLTSATALGRPVTGPWQHIAAPTIPACMRYESYAMTVAAAMAAKREDYRLLDGLSEKEVEEYRGALSRLARWAGWALERVDQIIDEERAQEDERRAAQPDLSILD